MNPAWKDCKRILCIRPDNMGDLLMTTPALRALKETLNAHITMLTSGMAAGIAKLIPEIDEVMVFDVPWVKTQQNGGEQALFELIEQLRQGNFDAAVIFTVYSQNPMPTIMLTYMAGIPLRLACCRENPYHLLTDWVPDAEPYTTIKHQVRRDLDLVAHIGAFTATEQLSLTVPQYAKPQVQARLLQQGVDPIKPWLLMHAGVSESKREYPVELWAAAVDKVCAQTGHQVLLTGSASEEALVQAVYDKVLHKEQAFPVAGLFNLEEFVALVDEAPVLVSVNTGAIHIAAATGTPTVVLYALTNPQHTPWMVPCQVLAYPVPPEAQSKNEVVRYVNQYFGTQNAEMPGPDDIVNAVQYLLEENNTQEKEMPVSIGMPIQPSPTIN